MATVERLGSEFGLSGHLVDFVAAVGSEPRCDVADDFRPAPVARLVVDFVVDAMRI